MRLSELWRRFRLHLPVVDLEELDPVFTPDELGATPAAEAVVLGDSQRVRAGTTDREAWILAVLSKRARVMFEFGTATGRTAYLWARNSPPDARVYTLTLPPEAHSQYGHDAEDSDKDRRHALETPHFNVFRYTGTPYEGKVVQLMEESKQLDESAFAGRCDLIFVDGSHAYSYVRSDTAKALRMLAPGGVVLWHDYGRTHGVTRALHELARSHPLVHLRGTSLAAYRAPDRTRDD